MANSIFEYTQKIGKTGKEIERTGKEFGRLSESTIETPEDLVKVKQGYVRSLGEFKKTGKKLDKIKAPDLLAEEHEEMKKKFSLYISSTERAISSLDTVNFKVDNDLYQEALNTQKQASKEIVNITNIMVGKINQAK